MQEGFAGLVGRRKIRTTGLQCLQVQDACFHNSQPSRTYHDPKLVDTLQSYLDYYTRDYRDYSHRNYTSLTSLLRPVINGTNIPYEMTMTLLVGVISRRPSDITIVMELIQEY